jgi:threonine/homoserine/homoserine lactone efflux protein
MLESIFVISIASLITGIIFSLPTAGPITVLIASNGLKGKLKFCHRVAFGASLADLVYTFIAVYCFSSLYQLYYPYIPYILLTGAVFLFILGIKNIVTKLDINQYQNIDIRDDKSYNKGGFRSGLIINFLNPTLFIGWLIASFLIISLFSSFGFNTGGLSRHINDNVRGMDNPEITRKFQEKKDALESIMGKFHSGNRDNPEEQIEYTTTFTIILSFIFAFMVALGSTAWFYFLGSFIVRHRKSLKMKIINKLINILGVVFLIIGTYFVYSGIQLLN